MFFLVSILRLNLHGMHIGKVNYYLKSENFLLKKGEGLLLERA